MKEPLVVAWSSGKDSALALQKMLETDDYRITLLTTVTEGYERVSMHGVREQLLRMQAESLGLPIDIVTIPQACSDEEYRRRMESAMLRHRSAGAGSVVFGDLFLEGIREYREVCSRSFPFGRWTPASSAGHSSKQDSGRSSPVSTPRHCPPRLQVDCTIALFSQICRLRRIPAVKRESSTALYSTARFFPSPWDFSGGRLC
jgi:hypothetical protein